MKTQFSYLLSFLFFLTSSCTEDYQLKTLKRARIFTIEGCITDEEGPYLIRIAEYVSNLSGEPARVTLLPVVDATVSITDDAGNRDELKPLWEERIVDVSSYAGDYTAWEFYLLMPTYHHDYDSLFLSVVYERNPSSRPPFGYTPNIDYYKGVYYTTSISGVSGRTYTLTVEHNNKTYTATDRMPYGTALDSVVMRTAGIGGEGKGTDGFHVPYLYFSVPQNQENFYLFTFSDVDSVYNSYTKKPELLMPSSFHKDFLLNQPLYNFKSWGVITVNGRFMTPYMADYKLGDGPSPSSYWNASDIGYYHCSGNMDIYMASISKPVYRYFEALTAQFYQDGGAFSHAPTSPPTNVSNGGQGVFFAAPVAVGRSGYFKNW